MQSVQHIIRLGFAGMLLSPEAYRDQRDSPDGLGRGFVLIILVGILIGGVSLIGNLGEYISQPSSEAMAQAIYHGLRTMPWFTELSEADPQFPARFDEIFQQINQISQMINGGGLMRSLMGLVTTPALMLLGWLLFSIIAHLMARALGGQASFSQTLACTALASGVQLLNIIQIFPFAQAGGTALLGLVASYVAIREAHQLPPWRAFWATMLGPIMLSLIMLTLSCVVLFLILGSIGSLLERGI